MQERILYAVDDQADNRFLLQQVFKLSFPQLTIRLFSGGKELLEQLASDQQFPALILLDLHMPEPDGLQTLISLKKQPDWKAIPVVIWTSSAEIEEINECYTAGAASYVVKPIQPAEFKKKLAIICHYWFEVVRLPKSQ